LSYPWTFLSRRRLFFAPLEMKKRRIGAAVSFALGVLLEM
jgi:hypothetical protein